MPDFGSKAASATTKSGRKSSLQRWRQQRRIARRRQKRQQAHRRLVAAHQQRAKQQAKQFHLDRVLLNLSPTDTWRIRDACEGTQVFGATGSGKTSGSGQSLALTFLAAGFGGLVVTAKPDERALWEEYCARANRSDDLVIFSPDSGLGFNFMDYEATRSGVGAGFTENLVNLFTIVNEVSQRNQGAGSGLEEGGYWERALKQLLRNAIELLLGAYGRVTLEDLYRLVSTAPQSLEQRNDEEWQRNSFCYKTLQIGDSQVAEISRADFAMAAHYWVHEFPGISNRTRSVVVHTFTGMADAFLRRPLKQMFCTDTTLTPEVSQDGKIILLDLPIKEYDELGRSAQVLFKYLWQRAMERRHTDDCSRPVFLWADESQYFVTSHDAVFQTTARSARVATVYLTQNISNYYAAMNARDPRPPTDSLLGNLQTKIFHANGDHVTNQWASDLIAKSWQQRVSAGGSESVTMPSFGERAANPSRGPQFQSSSNAQVNEVFEYEVPPNAFTGLRKGGPGNDYCVDAILFQGGRVWQQTDNSHLTTSFTQR